MELDYKALAAGIAAAIIASFAVHAHPGETARRVDSCPQKYEAGGEQPPAVWPARPPAEASASARGCRAAASRPPG